MFGHGLRTAFLLVSACCAFGLVAGSAVADVATLVPQPLRAAASTGVTPLASQGSGYWYCNGNVPIQNVASGYVIGECAGTAMSLYETFYTTADNGNGTIVPWLGGYFTGNSLFDQCGWIQQGGASYVGSASRSGPCSASASVSEAAFINYGYYIGCLNATCHDGTPVNNPGTCVEYLNFKPWLSGQSPTGQIRSVPAGAQYGGGSQLRYRYVAKYPTAAGNDMAMVHDIAYGAGQGNWVFVRRSCLGV